jgi:hypothetical protein
MYFFESPARVYNRPAKYGIEERGSLWDCLDEAVGVKSLFYPSVQQKYIQNYSGEFVSR